MQPPRHGKARSVAAAGVAVGLGLSGALLAGGTQEPGTRDAVDRPAQSPTPAAGWAGPVRPAAVLSGLPVQESSSTDYRGDAPGAIDVVRLSAESGSRAWQVVLASPPTRAAADGTPRSIEYGLVVDGDRDRVADCEIGISSPTPTPGDYRVWVRNLRTGAVVEKVGPPYGYPVEFAHPYERAGTADVGEEQRRTMHFTFLGGRTAPCPPIGPQALFYGWSTLTEEGRVTAWDLGPDAAWVAAPPRPG